MPLLNYERTMRYSPTWCVLCISPRLFLYSLDLKQKPRSGDTDTLYYYPLQSKMYVSDVLTCRLRVLVMLALGNEMLRLVLLVLSNHLESSSTLRSLSNLCRPSTWKGIRSTMLALLPHSGASTTCTMFSTSS